MFVLTIPFSYILPFFHVPLFSSLSFPQPKISCFNSFLIIFWSDLLFPSIVFSQFLVPPPIIFLSSSIRRLIFALFPAFTLSFRALPAALQTNQKRQVCCPALPSPSRQKERRKKKRKEFCDPSLLSSRRLSRPPFHVSLYLVVFSSLPLLCLSHQFPSAAPPLPLSLHSFIVSSSVCSRVSSHYYHLFCNPPRIPYPLPCPLRPPPSWVLQPRDVSSLYSDIHHRHRNGHWLLLSRLAFNMSSLKCHCHGPLLESDHPSVAVL